jgi:hypothetical protein
MIPPSVNAAEAFEQLRSAVLILGNQVMEFSDTQPRLAHRLFEPEVPALLTSVYRTFHTDLLHVKQPFMKLREWLERATQAMQKLTAYFLEDIGVSHSLLEFPPIIAQINSALQGVFFYSSTFMNTFERTVEQKHIQCFQAEIENGDDDSDLEN